MNTAVLAAPERIGELVGQGRPGAVRDAVAVGHAVNRNAVHGGVQVIGRVYG